VGVLSWLIASNTLASYLKDCKYKDYVLELKDIPITQGTVTTTFRPTGRHGRTLPWTEVTVQYEFRIQI
jgi:hypothetical protein